MQDKGSGRMSGIAYNSGISDRGPLLKTQLCTGKNYQSLSRKRLLSRAKQALVSLLLVVFGLGQPAAVNAQAEQMLAPLVQMGSQLAAAVVPMVIPVVVTGAIYGARAAAMAPSYIKAKVASIPRPHLKKKRLAEASAEEGTAAEGDYQASENVTGEVVDQAAETTAKAASAAEDEQVEDAPVRRAPKRRAAPVQEQPEQPARPKDPSEWYQD